MERNDVRDLFLKRKAPLIRWLCAFYPLSEELIDKYRNEIDWQNLVDKGANVYWDDHHHKFCVIDRKVVITGSFNWTYNASNRNNREDILVIENDNELIENFSDEFKILKKTCPEVRTGSKSNSNNCRKGS